MRHLQWLDRLRGRIALWLMPANQVAAEKQKLERIARELGISRSVAKGIAGRFFN